MIAPGCGWTPETEEYEPTIESMTWPPCVARDGYVPAQRPNFTVGQLGLCVGCLEHPADLLAALSRSLRQP